jgi:acetate kinase
MNVLVLNAGSSSLRFEIISTDLTSIARQTDKRVARGSISHLGPEAEFTVHAAGQPDHSSKAEIPDMPAALKKVLGWLGSDTSIEAVGHRVVHGGEQFTESAIITDAVLKGIRDCVDLAPLHNPKNIDGIEAARKFFGPDIPQVAVFDTAFHHKLPEHAYLYAIPYAFYEKHRIRRYGFHGTSHRYVAHRYRTLQHLTFDQTHVISLHLGNGCSAAAIQRGYPVDTSMGMTPLEGLVMGTRSGDIDATVLKIIAEKEGLSLGAVEDLLNNQSGLLGISGITNDMRELQRESGDHANARAALAIEVFCYRARKYIGAYLAAMGGADAILFTGGIGENSPAIRSKICNGLQWAGIALDEAVNAKCVGVERRISSSQSKPAVFCIPTDEELLIARDTVRCIFGEPHPS